MYFFPSELVSIGMRLCRYLSFLGTKLSSPPSAGQKSNKTSFSCFKEQCERTGHSQKTWNIRNKIEDILLFMVDDNLALGKVMVTITINRRNLFSTVAMDNVLLGRLAVGAALAYLRRNVYTRIQKPRNNNNNYPILLITSWCRCCWSWIHWIRSGRSHEDKTASSWARYNVTNAFFFLCLAFANTFTNSPSAKCKPSSIAADLKAKRKTLKHKTLDMHDGKDGHRSGFLHRWNTNLYLNGNRYRLKSPTDTIDIPMRHNHMVDG